MLEISFIRNKKYRAILKNYLAKILNEKILGIILFGSLAKNRELPYPNSDIDLIIIARDLPKDRFERAKLILELEKNTGGPIESIWMTPQEFKAHLDAKAGYVLDAIHDGKVLLDKKGFVKAQIERIKKELKRKGVKRVDGHWVWPIKRAGEIIEF